MMFSTVNFPAELKITLFDTPPTTRTQNKEQRGGRTLHNKLQFEIRHTCKHCSKLKQQRQDRGNIVYVITKPVSYHKPCKSNPMVSECREVGIYLRRTVSVQSWCASLLASPCLPPNNSCLCEHQHWKTRLDSSSLAWHSSTHCLLPVNPVDGPKVTACNKQWRHPLQQWGWKESPIRNALRLTQFRFMQETNLKGLTFYDKDFDISPTEMLRLADCYKNKLSILTYKLYNAF